VLQRALARAAVATLAALAFIGAGELVSWVRLPTPVVAAIGARLPSPTEPPRKKAMGFGQNDQY
jgi:hypothetical protein